MDAESGTVLYTKSAHAIRQPASTTKMMTGLLALEKIPAGTMISAPFDIEKIGESSLHLKPGEVLTREDALFALLLRSANDMAHTLAVHIAGSDAAFAKMMNARATEIGCTHTTFQNPHGLPNEKHTTCAYDLALIAREAMKNDFFRRIVGTQQWFVMRSTNQKDLLVKNSNKLLWEDDKIEGVKTGYTRAAGKCFVGARSENDTRMISVVLGSDDWAGDTRALFDFGFKQLELRARYSKGQVIGKVPIEGAYSETVPVRTSGEFAVFSPRNAPQMEIVFREASAPVVEGGNAGVLRFVGSTGEVAEYPLVFAESRDAKPILMTLAGSWITWTGMGLCGFVFVALRGLGRRRRHPARLHAR
jgi:D-alanyl-D-alanine carboxypeptidase (penicillin-binding protein 5/6)